MKKAKSLLALILCLSMLFAFVGCGKQQTTSTPVEDEWETEIIEGEENVTGGEKGEMVNTTVSQGDSAATAALAKNKEFLNSLKGLEINIYTQQEEKPTRGTSSGDRYYAILSKVAKKYDVTINYLDTLPGNLQQSILSGKPVANVIGVQDYRYIAWMNAGVSADLTQAMEKTGITFKESWYKPDATKLGNLNGKQYAYSADIYEPFMLVYNKRLIQENGLQDPIELYNSGKWNYDKLGDYLRKLKKISPDGKVVVSGLGLVNQSNLAAHLITNNGAEPITINNGKMTANLTDTKVKKALEYLLKWNTIDKTIKTDVDWKAGYNAFAKGNVGMVLATKYIFDFIRENNMTDAVGVVPFPYGPDSSANASYSTIQTFMWFIPKTEQKNSHKILFVMNEIYKEQYAVREDDFADSYRTLIRDTSSYNLYKDLSLGNKKIRISNYNISGMIYESDSTLSSLAGAIATGTSVETAINTYNSACKNAINDLWGKWNITG